MLSQIPAQRKPVLDGPGALPFFFQISTGLRADGPLGRERFFRRSERAGGASARGQVRALACRGREGPSRF